MIVNQTLATEIQQHLAHLRDIAMRAEQATEGLGPRAMTWSPDPKTWSIAQVLTHLNIAGWRLLPGLQKAVEETEVTGRRADGPTRYSLIERTFIRFVGPRPPVRVPVPPGFEPPTEGSELADALPRFLALQRELEALMRSADGLDLKAIRVPSVADARLRMCVGAWFHATVAHEQYHLLQIEALRANPSFPDR